MKKTLIDLYESSVKQYGSKTFLLEKKRTEFLPTTYAESYEEVLKIGAGLTALGLKPKEMVSILSEGRNHWILSELGLLYAGGISVPLSIKLEEDYDLLFRLTHAEVKFIFVSQQQLPKIRRIREKLPLVEQVIVFDSVELQAGEMTLESLKAQGEEYLKAHREEFMAIGQAIQNDDYATITYTSGTTADPKGVILTHRNYTANVEQSLTRMQIPSDWRTLIILPLDHCFAHVVGFYIMIACGASVATTQVGRTPMESLKNIPLNIREVKPHFLLSVPALAKNFRKSIESSIHQKGNFTERLFKLALKTSYAYNYDGFSKGKGWRCLLKPAVALFDKILYSKVRVAFGGELQFFVGGGALLDSELQRFFYAIGIPMYQGYGLSEATPVISTNANRPKEHRFGSSGMLVQPLDIRILDDKGCELPVGQKGEIVIRGENVMAGYWKNPTATADTVRDGWLYTGDMGYMTADNFLYVLGRFKSLLISADGEKYSPEGMEESIVTSPLIQQIDIYNNQCPYTTAIVVPNKEGVKAICPDPTNEEQLRAACKAIQAEIDTFRISAGGEFPDRWLPAVIALVEEPFTEQNGLVNSTMKVVRSKVEERYKARLDKLYTPEGKKSDSPENMEALRKLLA